MAATTVPSCARIGAATAFSPSSYSSIAYAHPRSRMQRSSWRSSLVEESVRGVNLSSRPLSMWSSSSSHR